MKQFVVKITSLVEGIKDHSCSWWYKHLLGRLGKGSTLRAHCQLQGDSLEHVYIEDNCDIDRYCVIGCDKRIIENGEVVVPEVRIGRGCTIGQYNHITAVRKIIIGENLLTGRFVLISDNSHGRMEYEEMQIHPSRRAVVSKGEIVIGNNVWIGDKVSILSGVHIGDGCVIGANSVITKDVPSYSVVVGSPARIIKSIKK